MSRIFATIALINNITKARLKIKPIIFFSVFGSRNPFKAFIKAIIAIIPTARNNNPESIEDKCGLDLNTIIISMPKTDKAKAKYLNASCEFVFVVFMYFLVNIISDRINFIILELIYECL